jgi:hypothetical protein
MARKRIGGDTLDGPLTRSRFLNMGSKKPVGGNQPTAH